VPLVLDTTEVDEIIETVARLAPSFGGINLEDISAPRCFEIERRLQEMLDIPVFHDDQHGTAIVVLAALENAARLIGRPLADLRVVVSGAGAAGVAVTKILLEAGIGDIAVGDSRGIIHRGRIDLVGMKQRIADVTNTANVNGSIEDALRGADVFIGVSAGKVSEDAVASMSSDAMVFALANPEPEVDPQVAARYAKVVATGRSDYPNQINNVLAFPGIFKGALEVGATRITKGMKLAAAEALAQVVGDDVAVDHVIPSVFDQRVAPAVAKAVAKAARRDDVLRPRH
jgi:malate dehydrogenase (oxaloacetate-decarboxylating)